MPASRLVEDVAAVLDPHVAGGDLVADLLDLVARLDGSSRGRSSKLRAAYPMVPSSLILGEPSSEYGEMTATPSSPATSSKNGVSASWTSGSVSPRSSWMTIQPLNPALGRVGLEVVEDVLGLTVGEREVRLEVGADGTPTDEPRTKTPMTQPMTTRQRWRKQVRANRASIGSTYHGWDNDEGTSGEDSVTGRPAVASVHGRRSDLDSGRDIGGERSDAQWSGSGPTQWCQAPRVSEFEEVRPAPPLRRYVHSYCGYRLAGFGPGIHVGLPSRASHGHPDHRRTTRLERPLDPTGPVERYDTLIGGTARRAGPRPSRRVPARHPAEPDPVGCPGAARGAVGRPGEHSLRSTRFSVAPPLRSTSAARRGTWPAGSPSSMTCSARSW